MIVLGPLLISFLLLSWSPAALVDLLAGEERELIKQTFGNPEWYMSMAARYPLVLYAVERLASGELDAEYNRDADLYTLTQGVSRRSFCPVWIASKTMHLAIQEGIRGHEKGDMYVSTLWDVLHAITERSRYPSEHWNADHSGLDYPTPYAFLIHEICGDLRDLAREACIVALRRTPNIEEPKEMPQLSIVLGIWAGCIEFVGRSPTHVSPSLGLYLIGDYLNAMLQIRFTPQDFIFERPREIPDSVFTRYGDLFAEELKREFGGFLCDRSWPLLHSAADQLDRGKLWVKDGRAWLDGFLGAA